VPMVQRDVVESTQLYTIHTHNIHVFFMTTLKFTR